MPSVLWRCWLGDRKGIRPVKNWVVGCWVVICLEWGAYLRMAQLMPLPLTVSCFSKIQIGFTSLVPAHLGSPGKGPLNGCVCVCVTGVVVRHPCIFNWWCLTAEHVFTIQGLANRDSWEEYLSVFLLEVDEEDLVNSLWFDCINQRWQTHLGPLTLTSSVVVTSNCNFFTVLKLFCCSMNIVDGHFSCIFHALFLDTAITKYSW